MQCLLSICFSISPSLASKSAIYYIIEVGFVNTLINSLYLSKLWLVDFAVCIMKNSQPFLSNLYLIYIWSENLNVPQKVPLHCKPKMSQYNWIYAANAYCSSPGSICFFRLQLLFQFCHFQISELWLPLAKAKAKQSMWTHTTVWCVLTGSSQQTSCCLSWRRWWWFSPRSLTSQSSTQSRRRGWTCCCTASI